MLKLIIVFLIISLFKKLLLAKVVICNSSSQVIILKENEIVFFESPNFQNQMSETTKERCKFHIMTDPDSYKKKNMKLIFVITNGTLTEGLINDGDKITTIDKNMSNVIYVDTKMTSFDFTSLSKKIDENEAFQGFVTFEAHSEIHCSLSNKNVPFNFINESEMLYLTSGYSDVNEKRCAWKFTAPEGYGIKIDILNITSKILVVAENKRSFINRPLPYFFADKKLTIAYTDALINAVKQTSYFSAIISIVPQKNAIEKICNNQIKSDEIIWETSFHGYTSNIYCEETISVSTNRQLYVNVELFEQGRIEDVLRFYDDGELLYPTEITESGVYVFFPRRAYRNLTWIFTSEENIISKGFKIKIENSECSCGESTFVIPCENEQNFSIMDNKNYLYCVNMNCKYEIAVNDSCSNNYAFIRAYFELANDEYDNFQILSDENVLINASGISRIGYKKTSESALIPPNRIIKLNFQSFVKTSSVYGSLAIGKLRLFTTLVQPPLISPKQIITKERADPLKVEIDKMPLNSLLTIELSKEQFGKNDNLNIVLEVCQIEQLHECITLYNDENLTSIQPLSLYNRTLGFSITIHKHIDCNKTLAELSVEPKTKQSTNCLFHNSILSIPHNGRISMISKPDNPCELKICNNGQYAIKKVWTTSKIKNVTVYNIANKTQPLFKFNYYTASKWQAMTFNALSYTLIMPPKCSVIFEFESSSKIVSLSSPMFSYYETPFHGVANYEPYVYKQIYEISDNLIARFTISTFDISASGHLILFFDNGKTLNLTFVNQIVDVNGNITINYSEPKIGFKGVLIHIAVTNKK